MPHLTFRIAGILTAALLLTFCLRATSPEYPVGTYPKFIISADLNNDGKNDIVTANYHAASISILMGNGDGTFQPEVSYAVGAYPTGLASGDFNGDGILDLAVANAIDPHGSSCPTCGLKGVSVLLGNGDGTFQPSVYYAAASGTAWVSVKDMNGDGKLDIVAAAWQAGSISVLLGNGDGTFQAPLNHVTGQVPHSIAISDFNGDRIPDLAVGNMYSNNVQILIGNGDGTFKAGAAYPVADVPHSICYEDFNHDGKTDLATANINAGSVTVLIGNGDGTFQPGVDYPTGVGTTSVYAGEFNADGNIDLVAANSGSLSGAPGGLPAGQIGASSVSILMGNGNGTFRPAVNYSTGDGGNGVVATLLTTTRNQDLAICFFGGYVTVLFGTGHGTF